MTAADTSQNSQGIAPLIVTLQKIQDHSAALQRKDLGAADMMPLLTEGWDFTRNRWGVDKPVDGLWRAPHLAIVKKLALQKDASHIVSAGMSIEKLTAGMWRHARVFPENHRWRRAAVEGAAYADPFAPGTGEDRDLQSNLGKPIERSNRTALLNEVDPSRDAYFVTLIGHTIQDISEFLVELENSDRELAQLLIAKNFMAGKLSEPSMLTLPWPMSCIARFKREDRADYLPPVLAVVLFAEFSRHAQVQAAHNRASFDEKGCYVDLKSVREDIPTVAGGNGLMATKLLLRFKWLQSSAILAPAEIMHSRDQASALAWTEQCCREILEFACDAVEAGPVAVDSALRAVHSPEPREEAERATGDFLAQPNCYSISRKDGTASFPNRRAITFHGMTWSENASVALTLIADQARSWSKEFRPESSIPERRTDSRPPLAEAIAALAYCWLETSVPAAFYGTYRRKAEQGHSENCDPSAIGPEDLMLSEEPGKDTLKQARSQIARLPVVGEKGYSAFAHASLWFDLEHDDLHHYSEMARTSLDSIEALNAVNAGLCQHGMIPPTVVASASFRGRGKAGLPGGQGKLSGVHGLPQKQKDIKLAAVVAQAEAMLLGPSATDPMRAYLLRNPIPPANKSTSALAGVDQDPRARGSQP